ncbi:CMRF35-like molecule 8 [Hoplias malabaricus]|uniref:CMRF35-like molecule 8 n=1 Tax=Hoplias malabaricus TaxID=27720 RepID=UPI003462A54D
MRRFLLTRVICTFTALSLLYFFRFITEALSGFSETVPLSDLLGSVVDGVLIFTGHVGEDLKVRCSHEDAKNNLKYLCNSVCKTNRDIIIKSSETHNPNTRGRFSIHDKGSGVFTVTISKLKMSDSGTYWCGVNRFLIDSLEKVIVKVLEALVTTPRSTPRPTDLSTATEAGTKGTTQSRTSSSTRTTLSLLTIPSKPPDTVIYIGTGLAILLFIFAILLFILIKQSKKKKDEVQPKWNPPSTPSPRKTKEQKVTKPSSVETSTSANRRTAPDLGTMCSDNEKQPPEDSSTIYSNIAPRSDPDIVSYATVKFSALLTPDEEPHYASVVFIRENTEDTDRPSSTSSSTLNPVSTSQPADADSALYSTVKKKK